MIFESQYRRRAIESWESEREATKEDIKQFIEKNNHLVFKPFHHLLALFRISFFNSK